MKKLFIFILILLFTGCAMTPVKQVCKVCPSQDILIRVPFNGDDLFVAIPKGDLDNPKNYYTEEEFESHMKKMKEQEEAKEKKGI